MLCRGLLCLFIAVTALPGAEEYTWWVDSCAPATARSTGCQPSDVELGRWALEAWQREANNRIVFKKSPSEEHARIRIHWAGGAASLYGETQSTMVDGQRGANIFVLPDLRALGDDIARAGAGDSLFRDAIVYLTCLHEAGHALGLSHTKSFPDIMYSFGYGGDVVEYFQRYRRQLHNRTDISTHSGISDADRVAIRGAK